MTSAASGASSSPPADPLDVLDTPEMQRLLAQRASSFPRHAADIDRFLESMPIMTTSLPAPGEESGDLAALQALAGEERTEDRVEVFKQSGNEAYKLAMKLKQEADKAEQSIAALTEGRRGPSAPSESEEETARLDRELELLEDRGERQRSQHVKKLQDAYVYYSQAIELRTFLPILSSSCFSNRALVSLALHNHGRALQDARDSVRIDRNNSKGWYRGAQALRALGKRGMAKDWLSEGVQCKHIGKAELAAMDRLKAELEEEERREAEKERQREQRRQERQREQEERRQKEEQELADVVQALKERGLKLGQPQFVSSSRQGQLEDDENEPEAASSSSSSSSSSLSLSPLASASSSPYTGRIQLLPDGCLSFPLLFLYPAHQQSDHIQQHHENAPLSSSLALLFPPSAPSPPWDTRGRYRLGELDVWVELEGKEEKGPGKREDGVVAMDGVVRVKVDAELSLLSVLTMRQLRRRVYVIPAVPTFIVTCKGEP